MRASYVLGIAGGSGSGKTTLARSLAAALPEGSSLTLAHDSYYRHRPELSAEEREKINFDHPSALDNELLASHLDALRRGDPIAIPHYDFTTHLRSERTTSVGPAPIVIVEGILVLADPSLRHRMDLKVYVDTDADVRVLRRIRRDVHERGRELDQIRRQYYDTVRPMHSEFVEPSKRHADLVIVEGRATEMAVDTVVAKLVSVLRRVS